MEIIFPPVPLKNDTWAKCGQHLVPRAHVPLGQFLSALSADQEERGLGTRLPKDLSRFPRWDARS